MQITIHDFSGVYSEQKFMQSLRESSKALWLDSTGIAGTDCYCDDDAVVAIRGQIADAGIQNAEGIHFIDGGNYHYMSKIWTDMVQEPFSLVVFDHHPDMQEPRFGNILSCGGWVKKVAEENKFVDNIVIIGVSEHLTREISTHNKVSYLREGEYKAMVKSPDGIERFLSTIRDFGFAFSPNIYISIDKDALSPNHAVTNWDQGSLSLEHMKAIISAFAQGRKIIGIDICGERARDFAGDEYHTVQEADALNDRINRELVEFLQNF